MTRRNANAVVINAGATCLADPVVTGSLLCMGIIVLEPVDAAGAVSEPVVVGFTVMRKELEADSGLSDPLAGLAMPCGDPFCKSG